MTALTFGKHSGKTLEEIYQVDPGYVGWLAEKGYKQEMRTIALHFLEQQKRLEMLQSNDLKTAFIHLARSSIYPGITGRVRSLDVKSRVGFAEISISSMNNPMDMEDKDFLLSISTEHPQLDSVLQGETYEDDETKASWTIINGNPNLRKDEFPSLERTIWYASDCGQALNDGPVSAAEALVLLSHHLMQEV